VLFAWIWRAFADREPRRPLRRSWLVFFISAAVLIVVSFGLGQYWQYQIRKLMGVTACPDHDIRKPTPRWSRP
jgi:uncharacterized membrane protein